MGLGEAITTCFSKYATFSGRARRAEYWYWVLFTVLVGIVAAILDVAVFGTNSGVFSTLSSLALLLPGFAVTVRRLHDTDRSGWWLTIQLILAAATIGIFVFTLLYGTDRIAWWLLCSLVSLAAGIVAIVLFVFMCLRGIIGPNRFGQDLSIPRDTTGRP